MALDAGRLHRVEWVGEPQHGPGGVATTDWPGRGCFRWASVVQGRLAAAGCPAASYGAFQVGSKRQR